MIIGSFAVIIISGFPFPLLLLGGGGRQDRDGAQVGRLVHEGDLVPAQHRLVLVCGSGDGSDVGQKVVLLGLDGSSETWKPVNPD